MHDKIWQINENGFFFAIGLLEGKNTILKDYLEMLTGSDKAEKTVEGYLLRHEKAVELASDEQELLTLPSIFPYQFRVENDRGNVAYNTFHYQVSLLQPNGEIFINPEIIGSYVRIDKSREYILRREQYLLLITAKQCNEIIGKLPNGSKVQKYNLENLSKIKQYGKTINAEFSGHIESTQVVCPDKLSVEFVKQDDLGLYHPEPVLLKTDENGSYEMLDSKLFQQAFNRSATAKDIYLDNNRVKYVCGEAVKAGLEKIKTTDSFSEEEYERFKTNPWQYFGEGVFEFPEGVYSDRVYGFINKNYKYFGVEGLNEGGWLPEEGTTEVKPIDVEITDEFVGKVAEAQSKGKTTLEIEGKIIEIDETLLERIARYKRKKEETKEEEFPEEKPPKGKNVLGIKTNEQRIDYSTDYDNIRENAVLINALKDGIELFEHQKEGIAWMYKQWCDGYKGVLLADDMGLGKTMQTLAFIAGVKKQFPAKLDAPVLIVAPVALLRNWKEEVFKFIPQGIFSDVVELHSTGLQNFKENGKLRLTNFAEAYKDCIVQTTYETLRSCQLEFGKVPWSIVIVDEAQKIKNPSASQTQALKGMKYDFAICLSGTPVENSWIDLWSIMDFVQPGKLGSFSWFNDNYQKNLKANRYDAEAIKQLGTDLQIKLEPLFLRRLKCQHLKGLPQKHVKLCKAIMPKVQAETYKNVVRNFREEKGSAFSVIAKLRDISLHPRLSTMRVESLSPEEANKIINESARLKKTFEILMNVRLMNEKALLFVVSKKMQLLLQYLIQGFFGIKVQTPINGDMNGTKRQTAIDDFNATDGFSVLILSPEAAGVGLNIVSANHVIHLSRTWNPAKEDQATDRAYRIGQKKDVTVYIPIAYCPDLGEGNSFDEKLEGLMSFKRSLSENVLFPTLESADDINKMFDDLTKVSVNGDEVLYWQIEDIDRLTGLAFEEVVSKLYLKMGYQTIKTPASNDKGADVIAWKDNARKEGLLIQCKQTAGNSNMNACGVQEIYSAKAFYEARYACEFQTLVITNANDFTVNAKELALQNDVTLVARNQLVALLNQYPVAKM